VPQEQHCFVARLSWVLALLVYSAAIGVAQHTVVENNGVGGKIETDYNAAEKATQMRTLGADGKLQQKVDYEYIPGYYVPQQTDTTYWPNGKVRKVAHKTYDESANFTGEFIEVFDASGKQIAGHKLTHDPWTGVYRCSEWNVATHAYSVVECPAGEEASGEAEVKKFTYDEVMHHLEAARRTARREQKMGHMQPATPVHPPITTVRQEAGVVFPAQARPGERISGTVVENPDQYDEMPEVTVTRVAIPFESAGDASRLSGWSVEVGGEKPQRADGPISLVVPGRGSALNVVFRQGGNPAHSVSKTLTFPAEPGEKLQAPKSFLGAALCIKGGLCMVSGPFSGDTSKTFAAFEDRPATIVAETSDAAYISIPELTAPGARPLFIAEGTSPGTTSPGTTIVGLPVVVGEFSIKNNHRALAAGESLILFPTLDGPGDIPDPDWQAGNFPATSLARARQLIPQFNLHEENGKAQEEREEEAKPEASQKGEPEEKREEKNGGEILLVVRNVTPEQISLRGSRNEMLVFRLSDEAFSRGEFKYDLVVEAKKAGKVEVKGYVIPLLAPVTGQEFVVKR
jgi:hypothetical protein